MAHHNGTPPPERGPSGHLPATRSAGESAVETVRFGRPPLFAQDLVHSLDVATEAVGALADRGQSSDVSVSAQTALVCNGETAADALQAAADVARQSPNLEPHSLSLARIPGLDVGTWEYVITMTVSARAPQAGEYDGATHQADRPRGEQ